MHGGAAPERSAEDTRTYQQAGRTMAEVVESHPWQVGPRQQGLEVLGEPRPIDGVAASSADVHMAGRLPPEMWNRLGSKILPGLRATSELIIAVDVSARVGAEEASRLDKDLPQAVDDLGLTEGWTIEDTDDE